MTRPIPGVGVSLISLVLRLGLGALFLFSASQKLFFLGDPAHGDPWYKWNPAGAANEFAYSVKAFEILPAHLVALAAFAIPWMELLGGLALVTGRWTRAAALMLAVLLGVFSYALISVHLGGKSVSCGCFGEYKLYCESSALVCKSVENMVLALPVLVVLWLGGGRFSLDALGGRAPAPAPTEPQ